MPPMVLSDHKMRCYICQLESAACTCKRCLSCFTTNPVMAHCPRCDKCLTCCTCGEVPE
jgi:hypothetical protein